MSGLLGGLLAAVVALARLGEQALNPRLRRGAGKELARHSSKIRPAMAALVPPAEQARGVEVLVVRGRRLGEVLLQLVGLRRDTR